MPLAFLKRFLERDGALVEPSGEDALEGVFPEHTRRALGLADEAALLTLDGRTGSVACGYGTELLRAACKTAIGSGQLAVVQATLAAPRPGAPEVFAGLNVALRPGEPEPGALWTLTAKLRIDASADDRRVLAGETAITLDADPVAISRPDWSGVPLEETAERPDPGVLARAEAALARATRAAAFEATAPFREAVARRARRDIERIDRYFAELDHDLGARIAKAAKAAGLESKRALLPAERERRLRSLRENALVRVSVEPVALLLVHSPVARASLQVLRRKARRTLSVAWHPALREWLPLACEGCGTAVRAFGACDEAVHVLCEECLRANACPRCVRGGPEPVILAEEHPAHEETIEVPDLEACSAVAARPAVVAKASDVPGSRKTQRTHREVLAHRRKILARLIVALQRASEPLSSEVLQAQCGASAEDIRTVLVQLVGPGLVEQSGASRGTRYRWVGDR